MFYTGINNYSVVKHIELRKRVMSTSLLLSLPKLLLLLLLLLM